MKIAGLTAVVLILMFVLRPGFFLGLFSDKPTEEKSAAMLVNETSSLNQPFEDMRRDMYGAEKLQAANSNVQYAPGYGPENFEGDAYQYPGDTTLPKNRKPPGGVWETLLKLKFKESYNREVDAIVQEPLFTEPIKALNGKEVKVKGYVIPLETPQGMFMFSAYPMAQCFFCGGSGPESIIEVYPKKPIPYEETSIEIKGVLRLNSTDPKKMSYILEKAEMVY